MLSIISFPMLKGDNIEYCKNNITKLINCTVFTLNKLKVKLQLEMLLSDRTQTPTFADVGAQAGTEARLWPRPHPQ